MIGFDTLKKTRCDRKWESLGGRDGVSVSVYPGLGWILCEPRGTIHFCMREGNWMDEILLSCGWRLEERGLDVITT